MSTVTQARSEVRSRLTAGVTGVTLRWQNEDGGALSDTPATFVYSEFLTEPGYLAGFGNGRGGNLYRTPFRLECFVFVPKGEGLDAAEATAETIAALMRSFRGTHVSCFDATVLPGGDGAMLTPPGLTSDVGNYFWASVEVSGHFDQVG